jgi:uncharacterized protein
MEGTLKQHLQDELKDAMRSRNEMKSRVLRFIVAAVKNEEVNARTDGRGGVLNDGEVLALIRREIKQHEESLLEAKNANREDLAAEQTAELELLKVYLPKQLSREEILEIAKATVAEVGATSAKQQGMVMKALLPKVKDNADGKLVSEVVRDLLK